MSARRRRTEPAPPDVPDSILPMLRRAATTLGGVYVAWNPGVEYVLEHPHCISLRYLIGYPSDDAMVVSLAADDLRYGPGKKLAALFAARGVAVTQYAVCEGKNATTKKDIRWLKMGGETVEPLHPTPMDQMASGVVVSAAVRKFILTGADDAAAR
ncbi:hypothetical protein M885DRAFT_340921 [Pelagophyceae sp. CCMP2097]|nr:hypothetical protein M885DRAFT_340921 [Pelagophyceae sp. CCMP2097]